MRKKDIIARVFSEGMNDNKKSEIYIKDGFRLFLHRWTLNLA